MKILFIALTIMSSFVWAQIAPDYDKESRWASHVEDGLMDGDIVLLSANNHEFISIYTPSETETKKTAIFVHGLGVHPDWPQVIQPLRVALTESGFNTLSIQMPVLPNGIDGDSYAPLFQDSGVRIKVAIDYIKDQGLIVDAIIAHSLGSKMSVNYLAKNNHSILRFVGVGMGEGTSEHLKKLNIPILDLYGIDDLPSVLDVAVKKQMASANNNNYTQKVVDADHFFNDKDDLLIETVRDWLR